MLPTARRKMERSPAGAIWLAAAMRANHPDINSPSIGAGSFDQLLFR